MVNTGLPSLACELCRQRRVKCDLGRPTCVRCERAGRPCNYRDLNSPKTVFQVHTPASYSRRQRRRGRQAPSQDERAWSTGSSLSPAPTEPWDVHIIPLILYQFSFPAVHGGRAYGSLECFPTLLHRAVPGSMIYLACSAVGNIYRMNIDHNPSRELVITHRMAYGEALQCLRGALDDPVTRKTDEVLLSVWLLCFYELMLGTASNTANSGPVNWAIHSNALRGLLRSRGREQFQTKTGCQLFQLAYHYIQSQAMQLGTEPVPEAKAWFETIRSYANPQDHMFVFLPSFFYGDEAARLCSSAPKSFHQAGTTPGKLAVIERALQTCKRLELSMANTLEDLLNRFPKSNKAVLTARVERSHLLLHIRNHFDTCVLRMYAVISELLSEAAVLPDIPPQLLSDLAQQQQRIGTEVLEVCATRILMTVPRFLPDESPDPPTWPDSLRLMWPLRVILRSTNQSAAARSVLERIAGRVGIMQAVGSFFGSGFVPPYEMINSVPSVPALPSVWGIESFSTGP